MRTIWITGLSGAGKSTLARQLTGLLRDQGHAVVMLDGDDLREVFGRDTATRENHSRSARLQLAMQYSRLCRMLNCQGLTVVIATISMFHEVHEWNRVNLEGYFEVYLKISLDELRRRDPKGIYRRFENGQLTNVAGLDLPVDEPMRPDLLVEFRKESRPEEIANDIAVKMSEPKGG